jgi:hypothetical protein
VEKLQMKKYNLFIQLFITIAVLSADFDNAGDCENILDASFDMSEGRINQYWKYIDEHIDTVNYDELIEGASLTINEFEKIEEERSNKNKFFQGNLIIKQGGPVKYDTIGFAKTLIKPDGYINYNNEYYRRIKYPNWYNFKDNWKMNLNPLQCRTGYVVLENDTPLYDTYKKTAGSLKEGTIYKIDGIQLDNTTLGESFTLAFTGRVDIDSISIIKKCLENVEYKIIGGKAYRFIDGLQIEIETGIYTLEDGRQYIEHNVWGNITGEFYFWEYLCDYFFDEDGNFIEYGYMPGYGA